MNQTTETLKPVLSLVGNYRSLSKHSEIVSGSMSGSVGSNPSKNERSTRLLSDKAMGRIWVRMMAIYGHKWASHLGYALDDAGLLSESAKTWQAGLCGVSPDNLRTAFDALVLKHHDWPPSLPEFRALCLSKAVEGVPSLDEVVGRLVMVSNRRGSLAARYGHPLVLAIAQQDSVDMFAIRTAKTGEAKRMVKPVYDRMVDEGWMDWPEHAHQDQAALGFVRPAVNRSLGLSALSAIRCAL